MTKLDRAWKNQLRMSGWIAEVYDGTVPVTSLKTTWLRDHGFTQLITSNCFFCGYNNGADDCAKCPGRKINPRFDCARSAYHYKYTPKAFYRELLKLDAKRRTNP